MFNFMSFKHDKDKSKKKNCVRGQIHTILANTLIVWKKKYHSSITTSMGNRRPDVSSRLACLHERSIEFTHILHTGPAALNTDSSASGVSQI